MPGLPRRIERRLSMRRRLLIAAAPMLCSACDDVLFLGLGWGKGIIPQGAIRPRRQSRKEWREGRKGGRRGRRGSKGFSVRGYMVAEGGGNGGGEEHRVTLMLSLSLEASYVCDCE